MIKQIICINWGTKYGAPYINRLYGMVARNITGPYSFTCFTDSTAGVRPEVRCEALPPLDVIMPINTPGIWPKARLWGAQLADLEGPVLFLDLDLVITGNIDSLFTFGHPDDVVLARNQLFSLGRFGHAERLGQTSVFRFPVGKLLPLQQAFIKDPQGTADQYRFEQRFVTTNAPGGVKLFPKKWIPHFRQNCTIPFPLNFFIPPQLSRQAKIVIFPGGLYPTDAIEGRWSPKAEKETRLRYLMKAFSLRFKGSRLTYLRHFLLPSDWVKTHWRE
jgi:hypothetical protein